MPSSGPLRILAISSQWLGANDYSYVGAFRRLGHSVVVVPPESFVPPWRSRRLRALRRVLEPLLVAEYNRAILSEAERFEPHVFFVFKGRYVTGETVRELRRRGSCAILVYPDVSFTVHGPHIPRALPEYRWVFTTKRHGLEDMARALGVEHASFLPHGYDPEVHKPIELGPEDRARYACDASFIGTWSPKKQEYLEHLCGSLRHRSIRIWGSQWERAGNGLARWVQGKGVTGIEYSKAIVATRVNLGLLSEARGEASQGDRITARTFEIPATGAFMLHERTEDLLQFFEEGREVACFESPTEMAEAAERYLEDEPARLRIARAGLERSLAGGYSVDCRAREIMAKLGGLDG